MEAVEGMEVEEDGWVELLEEKTEAAWKNCCLHHCWSVQKEPINKTNFIFAFGQKGVENVLSSPSGPSTSKLIFAFVCFYSME